MMNELSRNTTIRSRAVVAFMALAGIISSQANGNEAAWSELVQDEENLAVLQALPTEETGLRLLFEEAKPLPIVSESGITYIAGEVDGPSRIQTQIDGRLFCPPQPATTPPSNGVQLLVKDSSDHVVIDTFIDGSSTPTLAYRPTGLGTVSEPSFVVNDLDPSIPCFHEEPNGRLGLFGQAQRVPPDLEPNESIFADRFGSTGLAIEYRNLSVAQAVISGSDIEKRSFDYDLAIRNMTDSEIATVAIQELLPINDAFNGGVFASTVELPASVSCVPMDSCSNLEAMGPDYVLRGQIGPIAAGEEVTIKVLNRVISLRSDLGAFARLAIGAVAANAPDDSTAAHGVAEAKVWIVGNGTWIDAGEDIDDQNVTEIEPTTPPEQTNPATIVVNSWDSEPTEPSTIPKRDIPLEISSVEYCPLGEVCVEEAPDEGQMNWTQVETRLEDADLFGQIEVDGDDRVRISPSAATTEFIDFNEQTGVPSEAGAEFRIFSKQAGKFRLTFSIPQSLRALSGVRAGGEAETQVEIDFNPGEPASISIEPSTIEATAGICKNFSTTVSDQFGNPVEGVSVKVEVPTFDEGHPVDGDCDIEETNDFTKPTEADGTAEFSVGSELAQSDLTVNAEVDAEGTEDIQATAGLVINPADADQLLMDFDVNTSPFAIDQTLPDLRLTVIDEFGNTATNYTGQLSELSVSFDGGTASFNLGPELDFVSGELLLSDMTLPRNLNVIGENKKLRAITAKPTFIEESDRFGVVKASSEVSISLDPESGWTVGEDVEVSLTVTGDQPTGNAEVRFFGARGDGEPVNTCTVNLTIEDQGAGNCSLVLNAATTEGRIQVDYDGDDFNRSSESEIVIDVVKATSSTTITQVNPTEPLVDETYTVTVDVTGFSPTGTITVTQTDSDTAVTGVVSPPTCQIELDTDETGCELTSPTAGAKTLSAVYSGDDNNDESTSVDFEITVSKATSTTTITATDPMAPVTGEPYTVTVAVFGFNPTGTITVTQTDSDPAVTGDVGPPTCQINLDNDETGCELTSPTAGEKTLSAAYSGDDNNEESTSVDFEIIVSKATSTTTITATDPMAPVTGEPYTVTVAVFGFNPTGTITVTQTDSDPAVTGDVGPPTCQINLDNDETGCELTSPTAGEKTLSAAYSGDDNNEESTSVDFEIIVSKATSRPPSPRQTQWHRSRASHTL